MKRLIAVSIAFQFCSCGAIKMLSEQKITSHAECSSIHYKGKMAMLPVEVDRVPAEFIFDTGATASVISDTTIIQNFHKKKFTSLAKPKGADGKKVQSKFLTVDIRNPLFESENKVLSYIDFPKSACEASNHFEGIIGLDLFLEKGFSLQMDFTAGKICNLNKIQFQQALKENHYQQVKSKCQMSQIFVYLNIDGHQYKFKLDTGYTGNIIMPLEEKLAFDSQTKIELEGSIYRTISSNTLGKELIYENMPIGFGAFNVKSKLNVSSTIKVQNIGIDFIKAFDWLIDYQHNKVYVKRNQNPIESQLSRKISYYAKVNDSKLVIAVKEKSQSLYQLGDQIISINGQKITRDNQCEKRDLLNKTEDWSTLNLEVVSVQK